MDSFGSKLLKQLIILCFLLVAFLLFPGLAGFANAMKASAEAIPQKNHQASQESVYTIQVGSFKDAQRANQQLGIIEQALKGAAYQRLRVEKIGTLYTVRIGKFTSLAEAEQFLRSHKAGLQGAMVMKAYLIDKRILLTRDSAGPDVPEQMAEAPEDLNLLDIPRAADDPGFKLIGTVLADEPRSSMAIIEDPSSGRHDIYKEGDMVHDVVIKRILSRKVVIDQGKGNEMLMMEGGTMAGTLTTESSESLKKESPVIQIDKKVFKTTVLTYRHMTRLMQLTPYLQDGRVGGLQIYNIRPGSIFSGKGLEKGDVITSVKGTPIVNAKQGAYLFQALRQGGEVCIGIMRDESNKKLCFEVK